MSFRLLLERLLDSILPLLVKNEPPPVIPPTQPETPIVTPKLPVVIPKPTNRELLYKAAYDSLGKDMAPTQDSLGCAEAMSFVMKKAGVKGLPKNGIASTLELDSWLKKNLNTITKADVLPGDLIMSPTGKGNGSVRGHTGVIGKNTIMSNNSRTFKWDHHWTLSAWISYFEKKGGIKTRYYRWP